MKNMRNTLLSSGLPKLTSFGVRVGLSISLFAFTCCAFAQINLVPNWSFEDTAYCGVPVSSQILHAPPWFSANTATPDVWMIDTIHACAYALDTTDIVGQSCFQTPFHGQRFAGEFMVQDGPGPLKEYIEVELMGQLQAGHSYRVAMEVSLPECYEYALDLFGAYFSVDTVFDPTLPVPGALPVTPQVQFYEPGFFADVTDWMHVADTFVATGGERFMVIGSFVENVMADVLYVGGMAWTNGGYYYIDAVEVVDVTVDTGVPTFQVWSTGDDALAINWPGSSAMDRITVHDAIGRLLLDQQWLNTGDQAHVVLPAVTAGGIYLITVVRNDQRATAKWTRMH